jgi:hypothetical protein
MKMEVTKRKNERTKKEREKESLGAGSNFLKGLFCCQGREKLSNKISARNDGASGGGDQSYKPFYTRNL